VSHDLTQAILAVQSEAPTLPKDKTNPHFNSRFAGLDTITEKIGPILQKNGLIWLTFPGRDEDGHLALRYSLVHAETGEEVGDTMPLLLGKDDMQGLGSAVTYARRYALCAVLGLVADEDDDGAAAAATGSASSGPVRGNTRSGGAPSDKQVALIQDLVKKKKPTLPQLQMMLAQVGAGDVNCSLAGWTQQLTAGKEGTASALITYLKEKPLPSVEHPTDVPNDFDPGPQEPSGEDVPWAA
jgi:hypothetical protein